MHTLRTWLRATRPTAAINLLLPLALGQALAHQATGMFSMLSCLFLLLYGFAMQLYIVFLNDWADQRADELNDTPTIFSGGSRVLVEKCLPPRALLYAGLGAALSIIALGLFCIFFFGRPWALVLFATGLALLWAYSLPPLRLNYRGGGELLQALGVGLVLPIVGFYVQSGHFPATTSSPLTSLLSAYLYLQLCAAIAFAVPDEDADRRAGKRTVATLFGTKKAGAITIALGLLTHLFLFTNDVPTPVTYLPAMPFALALFILPNCTQSRTHTLLLTALLIAPATLFALAILYSTF
ncbi:MAG: prenyltransferase [Candidatus Latescibacterota bacterium]|jgi:1,4-dihydroxy-2-naphthoate octaprenyltransferase